MLLLDVFIKGAMQLKHFPGVSLHLGPLDLVWAGVGVQP